MERETGAADARTTCVTALRPIDYVACALAGILLATLPHLVLWMQSGKPYYIADYDDLCYLGFAGNAFFEHPFAITDPAVSGNSGSIMPYLQYAPGLLPAKFFAWLALCGSTSAGGCSRGLSIGLAWPLLLGQLFRRRAWAFGGALVLMADAGMQSGHLLFKHVLLCLQLAGGHRQQIFASFPQILPQWRLITPGLSFAYLLVHLWAVVRLQESRERRRWLLAGSTYGVLFYDYFYYWTSATVALGLIFLLDRPRRRAYLLTAVTGGLIGLPAVLAGMHLKADGLSRDWLARTDNFLPIARGSEWLFPSVIIAEVTIAAWWVWRYRREYLYVVGMAGAGLLLLNHQVITGLQIQNFHYLYVCGPLASLLCLLVVRDLCQKVPRLQSRPIAFTLAGVVAVIFTTGIWLRALETTHTVQTLVIGKVVARIPDPA